MGNKENKAKTLVGQAWIIQIKQIIYNSNEA